MHVEIGILRMDKVVISHNPQFDFLSHEPDLKLSLHPAPIIQAPKGLVLAIGSSLVAKVDRRSKLDNTIPSLDSHYRSFITTTNCSATAQCIDTFVLMGPPLGVFS